MIIMNIIILKLITNLCIANNIYISIYRKYYLTDKFKYVYIYFNKSI